MEHNCHIEPLERKFATAEYQKTDVALLTISGMGCPTCAARVRNSLISLYGVTDVTVNHIAGWARIVFNPDLTVGIPALIEAGLKLAKLSPEARWANHPYAFIGICSTRFASSSAVNWV